MVRVICPEAASYLLPYRSVRWLILGNLDWAVSERFTYYTNGKVSDPSQYFNVFL